MSILPNPGPVGSVTNITVAARDAIGNHVPGATVGVIMTSFPVGVTDNGNGAYSASYAPAVAGVYIIGVTIGGIHITGSPFSYTVN